MLAGIEKVEQEYFWGLLSSLPNLTGESQVSARDPASEKRTRIQLLGTILKADLCPPHTSICMYICMSALLVIGNNSKS